MSASHPHRPQCREISGRAMSGESSSMADQRTRTRRMAAARARLSVDFFDARQGSPGPRRSCRERRLGRGRGRGRGR